LLSFAGVAVLSEFSDTIAMQIVISISGIAVAIVMTWTSRHDCPRAKAVLRGR
jgi:hypothetical protein